MRLYTVHELSGASSRDEGVEFVHEGFCWPALFLGLFWLLYRRLWIASSIYVALAVLLGIAVGFAGLAEPGALLCAIAFHFLLAAEANDIWRWTLDGAGYREIAVIGGRNLVEAERDFFRQWSGPSGITAPAALPPSATVPVTPGAVWPRRPVDHTDDHGVLGLFPKAGG